MNSWNTSESGIDKGAQLPYDQTLRHFRDRGFMRLRGAFTSEDAARMRAAIWRALEKSGVREDDPSTWSVENIGDAGDVILVHPLLLHVKSLNAGNAPRFLLSGAVDLDSMWPAA